MSRSRRRRPRNRRWRMPMPRVSADYCHECALGPEGAAEQRGQMINRYGWVVIGVYADVERNEPPMAYTVGLIENFDHPELIIFGLPMGVGHTALNILVRSFVRPGGRVPLDQPLDRVFQGLPVVAKALDPAVAARYALNAERRARARSLPLSVVQIVWTDPKGRFPWDCAYDRSFDRMQPRLFEMGAAAGGNGKAIRPAQPRAQRAGGCARARVGLWQLQ
jgi:hypothetical protein